MMPPFKAWSYYPDHYNMLEVDLSEQLALFLRALYNTWTPEERPALLLQAMRNYSEYGGRVRLRSIIECAESPLPEQEVFLEDFLAYLQGQPGPSVVELTQETAQLLAGPAGPLELARIDPAKYAHGYLTWRLGLIEFGVMEGGQAFLFKAGFDRPDFSR